MNEISTKPYLIRAIFEWCVDSGYTPYLSIAVDANTRVPMAYVKNGEIILNISYTATHHLKIDNDLITFSARFGGVSQEIVVPVYAVIGIFSKESGQGMFFQKEEPPAVPESGKSPASSGSPSEEPPPESPKPSRSHLKVVK
jgi:stringent starvation protein B